MTVYQTWQDLLDEDDAPSHVPEPPTHAAAQVPQDALSERARELLAERDRLEHQLNVLTGKAAPDEDARLKIMYPVPVHTRDTRILQRRMRRQDELLRTAKSRRLQARAAAKREAELRAEQQLRSQRQRALQKSILDRWHRQRRALLKARAIERTRAAAAVLRTREQKRRQLEATLVESRLEQQRCRAADITKRRRSELAQWEQQHQQRRTEARQRVRDQDKPERRNSSVDTRRFSTPTSSGTRPTHRIRSDQPPPGEQRSYVSLVHRQQNRAAEINDHARRQRALAKSQVRRKQSQPKSEQPASRRERASTRQTRSGKDCEQRWARAKQQSVDRRQDARKQELADEARLQRAREHALERRREQQREQQRFEARRSRSR